MAPTVPRHRELGRGIPRALIRDAGLTREEFLELLKDGIESQNCDEGMTLPSSRTISG